MPATEVFVFMLINLKGKWKCPIEYFFQNKINAITQAELIKSALLIIHNTGLRVWGITFDGAFTNFSSMKILGCKFQDSYTDLKSWINHPISNEKVFNVPEPYHMLKLAHNTLGNAKLIITNKGVVRWDYIENLFKVQSDLSLKLDNKLSQAHVMWHQNKMKVKLAVQTLSSSTADALLFMKNIHMDGFHNVDETVTFCKNIDRLFDFLNSRNPFA
uniref:THAP domain-containing protein 9 n=1 Tax=Melanaphis sacchari TaxID=742174 RepID=A0A2H8TFJ2_9HEMI